MSRLAERLGFVLFVLALLGLATYGVFAPSLAEAQVVSTGARRGGPVTGTTGSFAHVNAGGLDAGVVKSSLLDAGYIAMGCGNLINLCPGETAGLYRSSANILSSAGDFSLITGRVFSRNATGGFSFGVAGTEYFGMSAGSANITQAAGDFNHASSARIMLNGRQWVCTVSAPTLSGFGTSPSILHGNQCAAFRLDVGTGGSASTGTITFPQAATNSWSCRCDNITTTTDVVHFTKQTGGSTTTCTVGNFDNTGSPQPWAAGDDLDCIAFAK